MLRDSVNAGGVATRAKLDDIAVAGIPATSAVIQPRGTLETTHSIRYVAAFTGYAPPEAPRYVVAVRLEQGDRLQDGPFYGGRVAAPLAARLLEALLKTAE
jgi:cell division protein FtsI/penicillin-binding protein 2